MMTMHAHSRLASSLLVLTALAACGDSGTGSASESASGTASASGTTTATTGNPGVQIPGCSTPVGISIDVDGYVWVVDQGSQQAFKVDPDTLQVVLTVGGLISPYTYSDMTGAGLNLVVNPPG